MQAHHHPILLSFAIALACGTGCRKAAEPTATEVPAATNAPAVTNISGTIRYEAQPGSKMRMEGTSSIHDWYAESPIISGFVELPAGMFSELKPGPVAAKADASIPVRTFHSSSGKPMDKVFYEHMNISKFPKIEYRLRELVLKQTPPAGAPAQFDSIGHLVVRGVTNEISLPVTMERAGGNLRIKGATNLKMTQFKIDPPVLEIVTKITTGNDVKIAFEWVLAPKS